MRKRNIWLMGFLAAAFIVLYGLRTGNVFKSWYDIIYHNNTSSSLSVNSSQYPSVTTWIQTSTIKSNITVLTTSYKKFLGFPYEAYITQGSGVIFYENDDYYYALTNYHVIALLDEYHDRNFEVEDYTGKSYSGTLESLDITYDLAVVKFRKKTELISLAFITTTPELNTNVVAIGQPNGERNTITFGKLSEYGHYTLEDSTYSRVSFYVFRHDAKIDSGSSGGVLINFNQQIIGINYAAAYNDFDKFQYGLAIPAARVIQYLDGNGYDLVNGFIVKELSYRPYGNNNSLAYI